MRKAIQLILIFFFKKVKEDSRKEEEKQEGKRGGIEKAFRNICRLEITRY